MAITAAMVKELREMTGAGMMDCKKALTETNGDMDAAVEFLSETLCRPVICGAASLTCIFYQFYCFSSLIMVSRSLYTP